MQLRNIRSATGKGLRQTARELGVDAAQLSNWETGKTVPDLASLTRLANFYGVSLDQLAGRAPLDPVPGTTPAAS